MVEVYFGILKISTFRLRRVGLYAGNRGKLFLLGMGNIMLLTITYHYYYVSRLD